MRRRSRSAIVVFICGAVVACGGDTTDVAEAPTTKSAPPAPSSTPRVDQAAPSGSVVAPTTADPPPTTTIAGEGHASTVPATATIDASPPSSAIYDVDALLADGFIADEVANARATNACFDRIRFEDATYVGATESFSLSFIQSPFGLEYRDSSTGVTYFVVLLARGDAGPPLVDTEPAALGSGETGELGYAEGDLLGAFQTQLEACPQLQLVADVVAGGDLAALRAAAERITLDEA